MIDSKGNSTSLRVCRLIGNLVLEKDDDAVAVDTISLVDYDLSPCHGCGTCFGKGLCNVDRHFNDIYEKLMETDGLFIVSPHYAPSPAKLSMVLEKIEQLSFLPRFHDDTYRSPLHGVSIGIVAHGGGTEDLIHWYRPLVLDAIANALSWPVEMDIVTVGEDRGVVFFL